MANDVVTIDSMDTPCPACGSAERKKMASVRLSPIRLMSDLLRCKSCGLAYVSPRPTRDYEKRFYATEHYRLDDDAHWKEGRQALFKFALGEIENRTKGRVLLDIGCGPGYFLDIARKRGWIVSGTEVSPEIVSRAQEVLKLNVLLAELHAAGFPSSYFDVATLWNVLDQMQDPLKQLADILTVLRPGGLLALRVSNLTFHLPLHLIWTGLKKMGLAGKLEKPTVFHLQAFDRASISSLLKRAGFGSVEVLNSPLDPLAIGHIKPENLNWFRGVIYGCAELIRGLTLGSVVCGPSLLIFARKPE